jgi:DNA-directed RNA polymerase subunit RPC12/RpoP
MPISLTCSSCGARLNAPDSAAGKKVNCPKCSTQIKVGETAPPAARETIQADPSARRGRERPNARRRRDDDERDWDDDDLEQRIRRDADEVNPVTTIIPTGNPKALIAYYCGVFSIIPCAGLVLGPVALLLGILGLRYVKANPTAKGTGHAIIGIVLGSLTTLANWGTVVVLLVSMGWAAYSSPTKTPSGPAPGLRSDLTNAINPLAFGTDGQTLVSASDGVVEG